MLNRASRLPRAFRLKLRARLLPRLGENGVAAVEFAIGALLLIIMAFGTGEFGLLLQKEHTLAASVRQAARVASTPCVGDGGTTTCNKGNRTYDDWYILRAAEAGLGGYWDQAEQVVIYQVSNSAVKGTGGPPAGCEGQPNGTGGKAGLCNIYDATTQFMVDSANTKSVAVPLKGTNQNLFKHLDYFEDDNGQEQQPQLIGAFGGGADCGTGLAHFFCPVVKGNRPRSQDAPATMGVYIQLRHGFITGLFGRARTVSQWSMFALEPHPDGETGGPCPQNASACSPPVDPNRAHLSIDKISNLAEALPGDDVTFTITVTNVGGKKLVDASVDDSAPGFTNLTWVCTATGSGASCTGSGSGAIHDSHVTLPVGGKAVYVLHATIPAGTTAAKLTNEADVAMPASEGPVPAADQGDYHSQVDVVVTRPDVSIDKHNSTGAVTVAPGEHITYQIVASNAAGPGTAKNARVTDTPPADFIMQSWSCASSDGGVCPTPNSGTTAPLDQLVTLPPTNSKVVFTVEGKVADTPVGTTIQNWAYIALAPGVTDPFINNNKDDDTVTILKPELWLTKDVSPIGAATPGGSITYTVKAANDGPGNVTGAHVEDTLDPRLTNVRWTCAPFPGACPSASGLGNLTAANTTMNLADPAKSPGLDQATFTIIADIPVTMPAGNFTNRAEVFMPAGFTDQGAKANFDQVTNTIAATDLQVSSKTIVGTPSSVGRGTAVSYKIVVKNNGPAAITGAIVKDIPGASGVGYNDLQGTNWSCGSPTGGAVCGPTGTGSGPSLSDTPTLPVGATLTYMFNGVVTGTAPMPGTLSNTATIALPVGMPADPVPGNNFKTRTVPIAAPDLSMLKTMLDNSLSRDQDVEFYLVVTNNGPTDVTGQKVRDTPPSAAMGAFTWTCATVSGGGTCTASSGGSVTSLLDTNVNLPNGASVKYTLKGKIGAAAAYGPYRNDAYVDAVGFTDPATVNNNDWEDFTVAAPVIGLVKTLVPAPGSNIAPGDIITYTVKVTNSGPGASNGVVLTDPVDGTKLRNVTWTCAVTGGAVCGASAPAGQPINTNAVYNVTQTVNLPEGATASLILVTTVRDLVTGTVNNTATYTSGSGPGSSNIITFPIKPPSLALSKTNSPVETTNVGRNTKITYVIKATNNGGGTVTGAVLKDTVSSNLYNWSWTCSGVCPSVPANNANLNVTVTLSAGQSSTYTLTAFVKTNAPFGNRVIANTGQLVPPGSYTGAAPADVTVYNNVVSSDVELVSKDDGVSTVTPGQQLTYTVKARTNGPSAMAAGEITVTDAPPGSQLTGVTWTCTATGGSTCGVSSGSGNLSDQPVLANGGIATYLVKATVTAGATGNITNTASVVAAGDTNTGNNSKSDTDTIDLPDLAITKDNGVASVDAGGTYTYNMVVTNVGTVTATGAVVTDTVDTNQFTNPTWTCTASGGASCSSGSGSGSINNHSISVPVGGTVTYKMTLTVKITATGLVRNTVSVVSPTGDKNPGNNSAFDEDPVNGPDLTITKSNGVSTVENGSTVTYTIVARNKGPAAVASAKVTDTVDSSLLSNVSWTCGGGTGGGTCSSAGPTAGNINSHVVSLPSGATVTYILTAKVANTGTGPLVNTATIVNSSGLADPTPGDNSATDTDSVVGPDVSITKNDGVGSVMAGNATTYTIVVTNNGLAPVTARVNDAVDISKLSGVTWTCVASAGATCPAASGTNSISNQQVTMTNGAFVTYKITGTVISTATGTLANIATVSTVGVTDRNTANNSAEDDDTITSMTTTTIGRPGQQT